MFGFLKRAAKTVSAYRDGEAYKDCFLAAQFLTMQYIQKLLVHDPEDKTLAVCTWSYLMCTTPRNAEMRSYSEQHAQKIEKQALELLDQDEPFREVVVSTLWVALGVCKGDGDKEGLERILSSEIFLKYSATYPLLSADQYNALGSAWMQKYCPPQPTL